MDTISDSCHSVGRPMSRIEHLLRGGLELEDQFKFAKIYRAFGCLLLRSKKGAQKL